LAIGLEFNLEWLLSTSFSGPRAILANAVSKLLFFMSEIIFKITGLGVLQGLLFILSLFLITPCTVLSSEECLLLLEFSDCVDIILGITSCRFLGFLLSFFWGAIDDILETKKFFRLVIILLIDSLLKDVCNP